MTSRELLDSVNRDLEEVDRRLVSGELDGTGRFYTDDELARGAATGGPRKPGKEAKAPAA